MTASIEKNAMKRLPPKSVRPLTGSDAMADVDTVAVILSPDVALGLEHVERHHRLVGVRNGLAAPGVGMAYHQRPIIGRVQGWRLELSTASGGARDSPVRQLSAALGDFHCAGSEVEHRAPTSAAEEQIGHPSDRPDRRAARRAATRIACAPVTAPLSRG
jgi:hypothetical protein